MRLPFSRIRLLFCALAGLLLVQAAGIDAQQVSLTGLRSQSGLGQFRGLRADAAGNLYTLLDAQDGVRLLKLDPTGSQMLAQVQLGQKGDQALALALDPAGNIYVAGTSLSTGSIAGTPGTTFPARADSTTNSFLVKFSPALVELWSTFLGSGRMAVAAVDASSSQAVVTGSIFANTLPVTANGIQQTPLPGSTGNGFVEGFTAATGTLAYATYLSGANGATQPAGIALDNSGDAFVVGTTSATGYPTLNALVPQILSDASSPVSGFVTKLTPAGDGFLFSTYVPGNGVQSVAFDPNTATILLSGNLAAGLFPLSQVAVPIANAISYQSVARISLDGSSVLSATLLAPADTSFVSAGSVGFAAALSSADGTTAPLLPIPALLASGNGVLLSADSTGTVQRDARVGGLPVNNSGFASLPVDAGGALQLPDSSAVFAGGIAPTLSSALRGTQHFDLALAAAPNAALPASVRDALPAASCSGSACAGVLACWCGSLPRTHRRWPSPPTTYPMWCCET